MHRACRRSRISRAPFAPLGSGAHSAPALVGRLLANAMRVRRGFASGKANLKNSAPAAASELREVFTPQKQKFF